MQYIQNPNDQTLQAYETHVQEYIDGTPHAVKDLTKEFLDQTAALLPKGARILELGSGFGRDASYLQSLGFTVECTDAAQAFVDLLNQQGLSARKLNVLTDGLDGPYDLILAVAVLLHFTREQTKHVLHEVLAALQPGGIFAFTLKQGEGETWTDNKLGARRYFCFWSKEQIETLLKETGFTRIDATSDKVTKNATWLQIIAKK